MLPKKNRLDKKLVKELFLRGNFINSPNLSFKWVKSPGNKAVSFIVPKNLAKNAVTRNNLRRKGYRTLSLEWASFPSNITGAFIFKTKTITNEALGEEIKKIINKI
jgi:hypothetical protein